jgi:hypothetical protein
MSQGAIALIVLSVVVPVIALCLLGAALSPHGSDSNDATAGRHRHPVHHRADHHQHLHRLAQCRRWSR